MKTRLFLSFLMVGITASQSTATLGWGRTEVDPAEVFEKEIRSTMESLSRAPAIELNEFQALISRVDAYHQLLSSCQAPERSESSYYERWDREITILQELEDWVRKSDLSRLPSGAPTIQVKAPLVAMTLLRGERNKVEQPHRFNPWQFLAAIVKDGKKVREVQVLQEYFIRSESSLLKQLDDSELNCKSAMTTRVLEMKTAATRFFFELPPEFTGTSASGPENHFSPLRYFYQGTSVSLFNLNNTYLKSRFKTAPERTDLFNVTWREAQRKKDPGAPEGAIVLRFKSPVEVPPGIYEAPNLVVIYAPEIRFHPNAVIVAPGGDISIYSPRQVAPWLDTSDNRTTELNGNRGGNIYINVALPEPEMLGTPLFVAMGSPGRWEECKDGIPVAPGNGGDGGRVVVRGGPPMNVGSNFLNIPGYNGGLYCNGKTIEGKPGKYEAPSVVPRELDEE